MASKGCVLNFAAFFFFRSKSTFPPSISSLCHNRVITKNNKNVKVAQFGFFTDFLWIYCSLSLFNCLKLETTKADVERWTENNLQKITKFRQQLARQFCTSNYSKVSLLLPILLVYRIGHQKKENKWSPKCLSLLNTRSDLRHEIRLLWPLFH